MAWTGRRLGVVAGFAVAAILAGCGSTEPADFRLTLEGGGSRGDIEVVLRDGTGLVTKLEPTMVVDPADPGPVRLANEAGDRTALVVRWLSRPCDDRMELVLDPVDDSFVLEARRIAGLVVACDEVEAPRVVRIWLSEPVDVADIELLER